MKKIDINQIAPVNYRIHEIFLFGVDLKIGGMASPDKNSSPVDAMEYLKTQSDKNGVVLIGLNEDNFEELAKNYDIEYIHLPIVDFTKVSPEIYDKLYREIEKANMHGKNITIHCGAGNGRTGTAIASLKLREIIETAVKKNPSILYEDQKLDTTTTPSFGGIVDCSKFVRAAIENTRTMRVSPDNLGENGLKSVETPKDIESLLEYENFIKIKMKRELMPNLTIKKPTFFDTNQPNFFSNQVTNNFVPSKNSSFNSNDIQNDINFIGDLLNREALVVNMDGKIFRNISELNVKDRRKLIDNIRQEVFDCIEFCPNKIRPSELNELFNKYLETKVTKSIKHQLNESINTHKPSI